ncbi:MAG: mechanosensitive ion channel family protein, partial [Gammaproteobacteria bacterium]|nr:mechanosensitive ion channel family protein [Gammaproteobacteria bacterium]
MKNWIETAGLGSLTAELVTVIALTLLICGVAHGVISWARSRVGRTKSIWDDALVSALHIPMLVFIALIGVAFVVDIIHNETELAALKAITPLRGIGVVAVLTWFVLRLIGEVERGVVAQHADDPQPYDATTLNAAGKLLRLCVVVAAALVVLQTLGFSIGGVLAFGGIGGIAIGFAAKDLLANFFGGLMIYLDRPFAVGDWVRSPDREIEGTVEDIGWRVTCVRNFDSRPLYIPNSFFTSIVVENVSRMERRRIYETIGIRYNDAACIEVIVSDITSMLQQHPHIDSSRTLMVNFSAFGPSSLALFVYCFTDTTKGVEYYDIKQDVLLQIMRIVDAHGAEMAFPTT